SAQKNRENVDAVREREVADERLELADLAGGAARPLREDEHRLPARDDLARLPNARAKAAAAIDGLEVGEVLEEGAPQPPFEEIILRGERDDVLAVRAERVTHEPHVEVARVVRHDDRVSVVRDERAPGDARLHDLAVEDVLQLAQDLLSGLLHLGR